MARLPAAQENAAIEAAFPTSTKTITATATNGTTTLTFDVTDANEVEVGMTVTGAGISSNGLVTAVNATTGVVTISGTITTLTTSAYVFTMTYYLALFTADPGTTGASGEVTGGSYARQLVTFGPPSSGSQASTNAQNFTSMPAEGSGVPYFGIFSALTSGTYLGGGATTGLSGAVPSGATIAFAIGAVTLAVS